MKPIGKCMFNGVSRISFVGEIKLHFEKWGYDNDNDNDNEYDLLNINFIQ